MPEFSNLSMVFLLLCIYHQGAFAEINLNILNNCKNIQELMGRLRDGEFSQTCREPNGSLEESLYKKAGSSHSDLCFLEQNPAVGLEGFSCMLISSEPKNTIFCMRPARASDINEYKEKYKEKYVATALDYLKGASACPASNGNATFSVATLQPILAALISKDQFGFIAPIGKGRKTDSYVIHSYSITALNDRQVPDAIEYIYALSHGKFPDQQDVRTIEVGNWKIEIDDENFSGVMNAWLMQQPVPARAKSIIFSISNDFASNSIDEKNEALSDISDQIIKDLKSEGFSNITKNYFTQAKKEEIVKALSMSSPIGFQGRPMGNINPDFQILVNEARPACAQNKEGATGVYIFTGAPEAGIKSDYGSVVFSAFGMGECAKFARTSTNIYLDGINDIATDAVKSNYENQ
ncbi:hypothetical protein [Pseudomonas chlororaphis]|uniref:hypothetical protein n=1 Tax=Pseudomonas chlororaphis TaxID=587753 RepID=UPI0039E1815D